jgi:hypothetical protein
MLLPGTILAVKVVIAGHVAVITTPTENKVSAALAPKTHLTRLLIPATDLDSWRPNGSSLVLRGAVLPGDAAGVAGFAIDFPAQESWEITVSNGGDWKLKDEATQALRMKDLSMDAYKPSLVYVDPTNFPAEARVRLMMKANGKLLDHAATKPFEAHEYHCEPEDGTKCKWTSTAGQTGKFTDRLLWETTDGASVTLRQTNGSAQNPVLVLKEKETLWLVNEAISPGNWPSPDFTTGELSHLRHFYDFLSPPAALKYILKKMPGAGPVFCPPAVFAY